MYYLREWLEELRLLLFRHAVAVVVDAVVEVTVVVTRKQHQDLAGTTAQKNAPETEAVDSISPELGGEGDGQAKAGAFSLFFGREKRLEDALASLGVHADAGVADGDLGIGARPRVDRRS